MSEEDPSLRKDPLNSVFPKVAKCTFNKFGPSGTIEKFDGLCILSLNIINEKVDSFYFPPAEYFLFCQIYVLLWFWFVFLSTVSAIQLIWRILSITSRRTREFILRRQTHEYAQVKQLQNPIYVSNYLSNFSKSMLPSAVPSSAWETGSSSSRLGRMWMSTCFQTS